MCTATHMAGWPFGRFLPRIWSYYTIISCTSVHMESEADSFPCELHFTTFHGLVQHCLNSANSDVEVTPCPFPAGHTFLCVIVISVIKPFGSCGGMGNGSFLQSLFCIAGGRSPLQQRSCPHDIEQIDFHSSRKL